MHTRCPNPFANEATIRFYLPQGGQASLEVFNLQGQRVKVLLSGTLDAGQHEQSCYANVFRTCTAC